MDEQVFCNVSGWVKLQEVFHSALNTSDRPGMGCQGCVALFSDGLAKPVDLAAKLWKVITGRLRCAKDLEPSSDDASLVRWSLREPLSPRCLLVHPSSKRPIIFSQMAPESNFCLRDELTAPSIPKSGMRRPGYG